MKWKNIYITRYLLEGELLIISYCMSSYTLLKCTFSDKVEEEDVDAGVTGNVNF